MKILLAGATGLVGRHALAQLLADARISFAIAPTRRALPLSHPKLSNPVVDFDALPGDADWWAVDAVVCALGTTIKQAGSREAFRRVDHDYPLAIARYAHAQGAPTYALNSAMGADAGLRVFYSRVKGELERDLAGVGFSSLSFVRPGLIGGERDARRPGEHVAARVLGTLAPILPRRLRINPAERVAAALVGAAVSAPPGTHVVTSDRLI